MLMRLWQGGCIKPMNYHPYNLPRLPRQRCAFMVVYADRQKDRVDFMWTPCTNTPLACGWCVGHAYVQELLEAACAIGCAAFVAASVRDHKTRQEAPALLIGKGIAAWEAYAVSHPRRLHVDLMQRLRLAKAEYDRLNREMREDAIRQVRERAFDGAM